MDLEQSGRVVVFFSFFLSFFLWLVWDTEWNRIEEEDNSARK